MKQNSHLKSFIFLEKIVVWSVSISHREVNKSNQEQSERGRRKEVSRMTQMKKWRCGVSEETERRVEVPKSGARGICTKALSARLAQSLERETLKPGNSEDKRKKGGTCRSNPQ